MSSSPEAMMYVDCPIFILIRLTSLRCSVVLILSDLLVEAIDSKQSHKGGNTCLRYYFPATTTCFMPAGQDAI